MQNLFILCSIHFLIIGHYSMEILNNAMRIKSLSFFITSEKFLKNGQARA